MLRSGDETVRTTVIFGTSQKAIMTVLYSTTVLEFKKKCNLSESVVVTTDERIIDDSFTFLQLGINQDQEIFIFPRSSTTRVAFLTYMKGDSSVTKAISYSKEGSLGGFIALALATFSHIIEYKTQPILVHKKEDVECGAVDHIIDESHEKTMEGLHLLAKEGEIFYIFPTPSTIEGPNGVFISLKGVEHWMVSVRVDFQKDAVIQIKHKIRSDSRHNQELKQILLNIPLQNIELIFDGQILNNLTSLKDLDFGPNDSFILDLPQKQRNQIYNEMTIDLSEQTVPNTLVPANPSSGSLDKAVRRTELSALYKSRRAMKGTPVSLAKRVEALKSMTFDSRNVTRNKKLILISELLVRGFEEAGTELSITHSVGTSQVRLMNARPSAEVLCLNLSFSESESLTFCALKDNPDVRKKFELEIKKILSVELELPTEEILCMNITAGSIHFDVLVPLNMLKILSFSSKISKLYWSSGVFEDLTRYLRVFGKQWYQRRVREEGSTTCNLIEIGTVLVCEFLVCMKMIIG
eukprot:TRINITY_DN4520_c0_g2_i6.p1 TRINITY_DN4520_c0_g2~~TRINITY_DN4520_c0_g2_i6.p1  ORF type:complete len:523 (-),score=95.53 TRINITY_DN4520_c0_g2_i6:472-2040(-)